ncbi:MAG TPA: TonB-dependent receptor [Puia sp.]
MLKPKRLLFQLLFIGFAQLLSQQVFSQTKIISGKITDAESGLPLSGVTVMSKETKEATQTDSAGKFSLSVSQQARTLVFSYVGFENTEMPVGVQHYLAVAMEPGSKKLSDVVVVGYGSVKKSDITGALASVRGDELMKSNPVSMEQGLQGKVAGVQVLQNDGAPGAGISVQIRGSNSFLGGTEPLYVVDGIPFNGDNSSVTPTALQPNEVQTINALSFINPADIESIEILKDASATAIYGSRGANGVVLITTRKGRKGRDRIELNVVNTVSRVTHQIHMLDAETYAEYQNESYLNADKYAGTNYEATGQLPYTGTTDPVTGLYKPAPAEFRSKSTNWQDEVFRTALTSDYNLSFSGGSDKGNHLLSFDYLNQQGTMVNSGYKRGSVRMNLSRNVTSWLTVGSNTSLTRSLNNMLKTGSTDLFGEAGVIRSALTYPPVFGLNDLKIQRLTDPYTYTRDVQNQVSSNSLFSSNYLEITLAKGLKIRQNIGLSYLGNERNQYYPVTTFEGSNAHGKAGVSDNFTYSVVSESILSYQKKFKKHDFSFMGASTYEKTLLGFKATGASNFENDILTSFNLAAGSVYAVPENGRTQYSLNSFLGRINYSYDDKYLATVSYRADGSSKFAAQNKWAGFPSFALAWKINRESFLSNAGAVSDLKLRFSYGQTGNQAIPPYASLSKYTPVPFIFNSTLYNGYAVNQPGNNDLRWETTAQFNLGLDLALRNIFSFTVDVYKKKTSDLLQNVVLPGSTGYSSQLQNMGAVENKGMELGLNALIINEAFRWRASANFSLNRNKILSLGDKQRQFGANVTLNDAPFIQQVGSPIGLLYGYVEDGFYNSEAEVKADPQYAGAPDDVVKKMVGEIRYKDLDGVAGITDADRTVIGNTNPKFIYGFTNNFNYKNFDLSIFIQGSQGNDIINLNTYYMSNLGFPQYGNITQALYDGRWTPENAAHAVNPKAIATTDRSFKFSRRFIENGSYVRIKNINLGYQLNFPENKYISSVRLFLSADNLLTITKYTGFDPDVNGYGQDPSLRGVDLGGYPVSRSFALGVKCMF